MMATINFSSTMPSVRLAPKFSGSITSKVNFSGDVPTQEKLFGLEGERPKWNNDNDPETTLVHLVERDHATAKSKAYDEMSFWERMRFGIKDQKFNWLWGVSSVNAALGILFAYRYEMRSNTTLAELERNRRKQNKSNRRAKA